jgi:CheY-like chemotaxis protein
MGDEAELREVLINMVFNAIEAMPTGGKITLSAQDDGNSVVLSVSDTGIGMTPEVRTKMFDPFFTTKGSAGLGLGLAVSFGIIRRHGSTIEVESEPGAGTTLKLVFPIASVKESESVAVKPNEPDAVNATSPAVEDQPKILVVDDEEFVRDLLQDMLEAEGCRVYLARSGHEGLSLFETRHFDAVFTDVGMPGMSGWEFAHAIRQRSETVPIAVITGWGEAFGSDEQKNAKVDWVVSKPFTTDRISELTREIKRRRHEGPRTSASSIVAA